jgi:hypothetical protein
VRDRGYSSARDLFISWENIPKWRKPRVSWAPEPTTHGELRCDNFGSASAINTLGHILGTSAYATPGTWDVGPVRTVVWRDGGVFDIQSLLDPVSGAGWTVTHAAGINNLGQIVGTGTYNGQAAVFVMTPVAP